MLYDLNAVSGRVSSPSSEVNSPTSILGWFLSSPLPTRNFDCGYSSLQRTLSFYIESFEKKAKEATLG
jgi:hypothetical protein